MKIKQKKETKLSQLVILLFAIAGGMSVANVYFAQPLLKIMAAELGINQGSSGIVITITQIGYGLGLFFIVPLGDVFNRRKMIVGQLLLTVVLLLIIGWMPNKNIFLICMAFMGLFSVVTQVLVAYAASLVTAEDRGRVVGQITSGIVLGILLARTIAGVMADIAGWRSVYYLSAFLILVLAIALFKVLPVKDEHKVILPYPKLLQSMVRLFVTERILRIRAIIALLLFASFGTLWTALVLPLSDPPYSFSSSLIGLFGLIGVAGALGATSAGKRADRGLGQQTTGIALTLLFLSWGAIAFTTHSLSALILGIIVLDLAVQAVHVTNQSMIFKLNPEARSRIVAVYMMFYSIGSGVGSIASTKIYVHLGWIGVCALGASFSLLALVIWAVTLKRQNALVVQMVECR